MSMPKPPARFADPYRRLRDSTRTRTYESLNRLALGVDGFFMTAVTDGTLRGVADWLVAAFGRERAYEMLQQRADEIVGGMTTVKE